MTRAFLDTGWRAGVAAITIAAFLGTTPALAQAPGGAPPPPAPGAAPPPPGPPPPAPPPPAGPPPPPDPNAPPPPGYGQPPPPGYGQPPPPGYGQPPPPGYGPPPPRAEPDLPRVITNYEEGDPIPPGYVERGRIRKGLVIGGSVTLGAMWLLSVLTGSIGYAAEGVDDEFDGEFDDGVSQDDWIPMFIPVVGPWVSMATLEASGAGIAILSIDGIVQAGGLAMLIAGIVAEKKILVRDYESGFDMTITPNIGPGQQGLGVVGHF